MAIKDMIANVLIAFGILGYIHGTIGSYTLSSRLDTPPQLKRYYEFDRTLEYEQEGKSELVQEYNRIISQADFMEAKERYEEEGFKLLYLFSESLMSALAIYAGLKIRYNRKKGLKPSA